MSEIDWSQAPEGATHYAEGSAFPWERENEDGRADFFYKGRWVGLTSDYQRLIRREADTIPRVCRASSDPSYRKAE